MKEKLSACLFITDHYLSSINGISLILVSFIENYFKKKYAMIIILELIDYKKYFINRNDDFKIIDIYVNAHYPSSDRFLKNKNYQFFLN
tara:strand:+ start:46 stop:312 length:267 start_codon:yes stop_codon:yes gene_type:complete